MNGEMQQRKNVEQAIDDAAALAQIFLPQFSAYIALGRVVAKAAPELYEDVLKLVGNAEPTAAEKAELLRKLEALANPDV